MDDWDERISIEEQLEYDKRVGEEFERLEMWLGQQECLHVWASVEGTFTDDHGKVYECWYCHKCGATSFQRGKE